MGQTENGEGFFAVPLLADGNSGICLDFSVQRGSDGGNYHGVRRLLAQQGVVWLRMGGTGEL